MHLKTIHRTPSNPEYWKNLRRHVGRTCPRLLDCSWTLSHEPGAGTADVQVDISVETHDRSEAFVLAASAVRAAVHAAGGFTPDWTSAPPSGSLVATALNSARELIET
jgi:hypothetical protein